MLRPAALALLALANPAGADPSADEVLVALTGAGAQVILLGEVHDNPHHHAFQARAVAALAPAALVFEMLTPEQAALVTPALAADPQALAAALDWENTGWPDFAMYAPLLAHDARSYGAGVPRAVAQRVFAEGAAAVMGAGAARFGLDRALDPGEQAAREAEQMAVHCDALPEDLLPGFVAAQRLRDAVLAETALAALSGTGGPVVVITGNGHARTDRGIPALLSVAAPDVAVLSLGLLEEDPDGAAPYDFTLVTPPADRPDPCAEFR